MSNNNKQLFIHLGCSGFPYGNAQIQRIRLTFKGLKLAGCETLVINKHSVIKNQNPKSISHFQGIPYVYTSVYTSRPDSFIGRNLNKFSGYWGEFKLLICKRKKIHTAIYYDSSFVDLLYYRLLSKVLRFKLIVQYVELRSSVKSEKKRSARIQDLLFDNYSFFFCDGIIVISEFLRKRVMDKRKSMPIVKIPAICDFSEFDSSEKVIEENYLMYCGAIGYLTVISFIIELYCKLRDLNLYDGNLVFAIGFGENDSVSVRKLIKLVKECKYSQNIQLNSNVPYKDLIGLYLKAELLIVPLRDNLQDIAGFHHKIGEYTAAGKPIISTKKGELAYYFEDGVSAILADEYTVDSYVAKLATALSSKTTLKHIGLAGQQVGYNNLNYVEYGYKLKSFASELK